MPNPSHIKVSVIVPVHNAEKYLAQCLDSLMKQTLQALEVILINDCSTDTSGEICEQYAAKDSRFIVVHNEQNIRQGLSRNKGIEMARGEYVGFVDADDWVDLDYYEKLYQAATSKKTDIAKTEYFMVYPDQANILQKKLNQNISHGLRQGLPLFLLFSYEHWTAIYRRKPLMEHHIRYPDIRNAQDDVFLLYCTYYCKSIALISGTYYYYRQHPASTIHTREQPYYDSILQGSTLEMEVHK